MPLYRRSKCRYVHIWKRICLYSHSFYSFDLSLRLSCFVDCFYWFLPRVFVWNHYISWCKANKYIYKQQQKKCRRIARFFGVFISVFSLGLLLEECVHGDQRSYGSIWWPHRVSLCFISFILIVKQQIVIFEAHNKKRNWKPQTSQRNPRTASTKYKYRWKQKQIQSSFTTFYKIERLEEHRKRVEYVY